MSIFSKSPKSRLENNYEHRPMENGRTGTFSFDGVCFPSQYRLNNILERYARYLELYCRFREYDRLSPEEKEQMRLDAIAYTEKRREDTYNPPKLDYEAPFLGTALSTTDDTPRTPENTYVIPDCYYGCGCAPCSCTEDYIELQIVKEEFENVETEYGKQWLRLDDVLKEMDKIRGYKKIKN